MNNSPINSTINSTTVVELADASSLRELEFRRAVPIWKKDELSHLNNRELN